MRKRMIKMIKILAKYVRNTVRIAKMPTLEILLAARLTGNPSQKNDIFIQC